MTQSPDEQGSQAVQSFQNQSQSPPEDEKMKITLMKRAIERYTKIRSYRPYERVLRSVQARGDVWMASQGEYAGWWDRRHRASLSIRVSEARCSVRSDLEGAVFEKFPGEFLTSHTVGCPDCSLSGDVQWVVDASLARRDLLIEALRREGIMNTSIGKDGEFFLSHELDDILEMMEGHLRRQELAEYDETIVAVRDLVVARLAKQGLPLIRIWYNPRIDGKVMKGVFSPRHDVERALTNVPRIVKLEHEHGARSTVYIRVFQPFYNDKEINKLTSLSDPVEIALHAEFFAHAEKHGSEEAAARADKAHLEAVAGVPVAGVSNHGGELVENYTPNYWGAVEGAGFLWTISQRAFAYYLPYRWLTNEGNLSDTYCICYQFRDIGIPYKNFAEVFYEQALQDLEQALEHGGALVLMFHPGFFGFFSYLLTPKNFLRLARFMPTYAGRILQGPVNRTE